MSMLFRFFKACFVFIWRGLNFARELFFNFIFLIIVAGLFIAYQQQSSSPSVPEYDTSALLLDLSGKLVEQGSTVDALSQLSDEILGSQRVGEIDLYQVQHAINSAKDDDDISGLVLQLSSLSGTDMTKLRLLGQSIEDFKTSGKPVVAIGDNYDQHQYYLASYADTILLNPAGGVWLRGFASQNLYFKEAFEKFNVNTHVFRVGTHKSFVEPYIRNNMSDEARADLKHWMDQLWTEFKSDIIKNREQSEQQMFPDGQALITKLKEANGDAANYAMNAGLVDVLMTRDDERSYLMDTFGAVDNGLAGDYHHVSFAEYRQRLDPVYPSVYGEDRIALIHASGPIVGKANGNGQVIESESMLEMLDQVLLDDNIKGLVLRVDSPGGSAFAAELIRNKLQEIQLYDKPVVISMGNVAASGGYWIAADADQIFASPTTITGSIGIFAMFATFEDVLSDFGVYSDGYATSSYASIGITQKLSEEVAQVIQLNIESGYQKFIGLVANGRDLSLEQADSLAQGRIWTGKDAQQNGLVDQLGDLDDAVAYTRSLLGNDELKLEQIRPNLSRRDEILQQMFGQQGQAWLNSYLPDFAQWIHHNQVVLSPLQFKDPMGRYAFCAMCESY
ncbi:signal peptide peptidase SppA [Alginatibacterium sediminis]|uniref:Signal peptide peptidase SppA n=1 Tax=Alginatibacterium sediminis TaxID=2164068 RepID=A0A420EIC3_9ALTE|nr:signal peptide peptidase SppA [Alginatibacterium sediminis]RKF20430.1 signal peptide peptidase SppA [Alginatibacterium sediminis]